ncbi:MAG: hypothetical protein ACOX1U_00935 [Saccharofermentanales bacterium]|jgi:DNA-directed RNA polymerase subunit RPC12/RpoP|nr:hypothetical protein [Oscillospiraceae bacterium]
MTEIRYYPLIDCDSDGTEKVAMIPTPNGNTVKAQSKMWLEEMVPHHFRLYSQNSNSADNFNIRCPRCGTALKRISGVINETKRGLYVCYACHKI